MLVHVPSSPVSMKIILIVLSWVVSSPPGVMSGCISRNRSSRRLARIMGGTEANIVNHPYAVSLKKFGRPHCGGTLINKLYVVTAAHCAFVERPDFPTAQNGFSIYQMDSAQAFTVMTGVQNVAKVKGTETTYEVQSITVHESYKPGATVNSQHDHDIALFKLKEPGVTEWTEYAQPMCIDSEDPAPGTMGILVGWGYDKYPYDGGQMTNDLYKAKIPIVPNSECKKKFFPEVFQLDPNIHLCAGYKEGKIDGCQNDSGAGLVVEKGDQMELVGIMSGGVSCGLADKPGIYTRVSHYLDWINENSRIN